MKSKITMAVLATLLLTLAMATAAFAQSGQDGYIEEGPAVLDQTGSDGSPPSGDAPSTGDEPANSAASPDTTDELPFTGLDLGLVAVAGASLLLLGVGMRRLTQGPDSV